jgi:very-short-patch-repair endonuclease
MSTQMRWTHDKILKEALKHTTRYDFQKYSNRAYQAALRMGILDQVCAHMKAAYHYWTDSELYQEALKYTNRWEFQKYSQSAYEAARMRGILNNICGHMDSLYNRWTDEGIHKEAIKYTTRNEFKKGNYGAYQAACIRGILDQVCGHMKDVYFHRTDHEIHQEALKFTTRWEFQKHSHNAYSAARIRGILDMVCSHMKRSSNDSLMEKEIFDTIKSVLPSVKKLRVRKKNMISSRTYIKGFDIDILVSELNMGIEVDGKYHHSFKYMRKNKQKRDWPDEAILNYHEIKDEYFLNSHGIKILHIKEEDWLVDKQACIDRCLAFLGVEQKKVA